MSKRKINISNFSFSEQSQPIYSADKENKTFVFSAEKTHLKKAEKRTKKELYNNKNGMK